MRKVLAFLFLLSSLSVAQNYNASYLGTAMGPTSSYTTTLQAIPNATVTVFKCTGAGNTCGTLAAASLCTSITDTSCTQTNVLFSDTYGNFKFYIKPGRYAYNVVGTGFASTTYTDVIINEASGDPGGPISGPTTCSPNQFLQWNGTNWVCASGGTGGVGGTGTANSIPVWTNSTTLGNSSITDDGTTVSTSELFRINGSSTSVNFFVNGGTGEIQNTPSTCSGTGGATVFTFLPCGKASWGVINAPAGTTGYAAAVLGEITNNLTWTGNGSLVGVVGNSNPGGSGNLNWVAGVVGTSLPDTTGTTANSSGVVGVGMASNAAATTLLDGLDAQIVTQVSATVTTGAGLLVRSPSLTNGTVSSLSGILIQDQTGGGGLNPSPASIRQQGNGINVFTGHLDQNASGNWAGTCTMTTTTCTIALTVAYTGTPGCVVTVQGGTAIAGACSVSGTTVTVTAASSNTATWAAMLFGNPN